MDEIRGPIVTDDEERRERENALRAQAARLVQAIRHRPPGRRVPPEMASLVGPVRHLAQLLDADAPIEHLQQAALAIVDAYEWPDPEVVGGAEGAVADAAVLGAVERLRQAADELDELDDDPEPR